jgi:hypothetical protein
LKYVPSFFAMDALAVATCVMPAALAAGNTAAAPLILLRRTHHQVPSS